MTDSQKKRKNRSTSPGGTPRYYIDDFTALDRKFRLSEWLQTLSPHTVRAYTVDVSRFLRFTKKPVQAIKPYDIEHFLGTHEGSSPATKVRCLTSLRSFFRYLHTNQCVSSNPAAEVKLPSSGKTQHLAPPSRQAINRMIEKEPVIRNKALLIVLVNSGIRPGELLALTWKDIDDKNGVISVMQTKAQLRRYRRLRLPSFIFKALRELRADAPLETPVFRSQKGGHLTLPQLHRIVSTAGKRIGLLHISPLTLRHVFATGAVTDRVDLSWLQSCLGYASLKSLDRYV